MRKFIGNLGGDKSIWAIVTLFSLISFLPVYSASSNLVYVIGKGTPLGYLLKHSVLLLFGMSIMYAIHKIPYNYFKGLSILALPVVIGLLVFTLSQGQTISGANASRWLYIKYVGFSFQTSTFAAIVLIVYVARYFSKLVELNHSFNDSLIYLWLPVFITVGLILPASLSSAFMLFFMICVMSVVSNYPFKYLLKIVGVSVVLLTFFILTVKAFPDMFPNRVDTWISRFESYFSDTNDLSSTSYQIDKAKMAIATGGVTGIGAGKSVMKNFLPQSSSDFIFAIITEEYGLLGAFVIILLYLGLLFRFLIVINKAKTIFGKLLVTGLGYYIMLQALVNMSVTVEIIPVTGQNLPLISSGGTSILMTCLAIGIILCVSNNINEEQKIEEQQKEKQKSNVIELLNAQV